MVSLSDSYAETTDLLDAGKTKAAAEEFSRHFTPPLKKLYSEAGQVYPLRFANAKAWCEWTKRFYTLTRETEDCLAENRRREARTLLEALRKHVYDLHVETKTQKTNDYVYALHLYASEKRPDALRLRATNEGLAKAEPSAKAEAEPEFFEESKKAWQGQTGKALAQDKVPLRQKKKLRKAANRFYREFGVQFQ